MSVLPTGRVHVKIEAVNDSITDKGYIEIYSVGKEEEITERKFIYPTSRVATRQLKKTVNREMTSTLNERCK